MVSYIFERRSISPERIVGNISLKILFYSLCINFYKHMVKHDGFVDWMYYYVSLTLRAFIIVLTIMQWSTLYNPGE